VSSDKDEDLFGEFSKFLITLQIAAATIYSTSWVLENGIRQIIQSITIPPYWQGVINTLVLLIVLWTVLIMLRIGPRVRGGYQ